MIPSSVRRVIASAPQGVVASSVPKVVVVGAPHSFTRGHQRRCSSSKPSRSDNDSNGISSAADESVAASSTTTRPDSKRKRRSKDAGDSFKKLPSVPSTHHMSQEALGLSSFFSLYRPISITQTMPRTVTEEHFASIFTPRTKSSKISETVTALSDSVELMEGSMAAMTISPHHDGQDLQDGFQRVEVKNPDGSDSTIQVQIDAMSGEFLPFRPPPLPQPQTADGASSQAQPAEEKATSTRRYNAVFTIDETTEANGQIKIVAHSARIVDEEQPRSFLERLAQRQLKFDEVQQARRDMHAISVQRQRKLKMKKKKYKKLMRKTRNERRKLGRT